VVLRDVVEADLAIFFEQQLDPEATYMAAFTANEPADGEAFMARWAKILKNDAIVKRTILFGEAVIGHVVAFQRFGEHEVTYWLGREYWLATEALAAFLQVFQQRPLYARVAADNAASLRVLQKSGFVTIAQERAFANARGEQIDELVLVLG